jgi:hypothetical protein
MSSRLRLCVECPNCHTRYVIGGSPYRNGSYIVFHASRGTEFYRLFCVCSQLQDFSRFKMHEPQMYAVSGKANDRGYGSPDEIVLLEAS